MKKKYGIGTHAYTARQLDFSDAAKNIAINPSHGNINLGDTKPRYFKAVSDEEYDRLAEVELNENYQPILDKRSPEGKLYYKCPCGDKESKCNLCGVCFHPNETGKEYTIYVRYHGVKNARGFKNIFTKNEISSVMNALENNGWFSEPEKETYHTTNKISTMMAENRSLVSIESLSREKILSLIHRAEEFEKNPNSKILDGKIVATLFFEPSTRTRLSFETAANRLGAKVIGFADPKITSGTKGETLKDTIMMVQNYADVIVMRHYLEGAALYASEVANVPIINAGDGANQHPTQTMLDLYSIYKTQGTLDNLNVFLVGDLKYGRTVHSLIMALRHFNPTFHFIAPKELAMPEEYKTYCKEHGITYVEHEDFNEDIIAEADILYMTRVQRERFTDLMEYERVKDVYILKASMLGKARDNMKILHPLPRVNEIAYDVDDVKHAYYFQQAQNGLYAREAIICDVLNL